MSIFNWLKKKKHRKNQQQEEQKQQEMEPVKNEVTDLAPLENWKSDRFKPVECDRSAAQLQRLYYSVARRYIESDDPVDEYLVKQAKALFPEPLFFQLKTVRVALRAQAFLSKITEKCGIKEQDPSYTQRFPQRVEMERGHDDE